MSVRVESQRKEIGILLPLTFGTMPCAKSKCTRLTPKPRFANVRAC